jgi:hypothetical protein
VVPQRAKPGRKSTKQNVKNDCATAIGSAATSAQDADGVSDARYSGSSFVDRVLLV